MYSSPSTSRRSVYNNSSTDIATRPTRPAGVPMACYKRMNTTELEETIDLSTLSEKETQTLLKELYLRYKINMISNAQLYNEKQALTYHVEDLQDQLEVEVASKQAKQLELKNWNKQVEDAKRRQLHMDQEISQLKSMIEQRDSIISDNDLVMVAIAPLSDTGDKKTDTDDKVDSLLQCTKRSSSSFDTEMKKLIGDNEQLKCQIGDTRKELNGVREDKLTKWRQTPKLAAASCASAYQVSQQQEQQKELSKHQQTVTQANLKIDSLENQLLRLESQMHRYREVCEESDKVQLCLRSHNHKLSRQTEEAHRQVEELARICDHLQIRMDKVKIARLNALSTVSNHAD